MKLTTTTTTIVCDWCDTELLSGQHDIEVGGNFVTLDYVGHAGLVEPLDLCSSSELEALGRALPRFRQLDAVYRMRYPEHWRVSTDPDSRSALEHQWWLGWREIMAVDDGVRHVANIYLRRVHNVPDAGLIERF